MLKENFDSWSLQKKSKNCGGIPGEHNPHRSEFSKSSSIISVIPDTSLSLLAFIILVPVLLQTEVF